MGIGVAATRLKVRPFSRCVPAEQEARVVALIDALRALEQWLGLRVGAGGLVQLGENVEREGGVWMLGAERLLADGERALQERLGLRVGASGLVDHGEIDEREGGVRVLGTERL